MIECRRLFLRSDFLSDITQPCPLPATNVQFARVLSTNNGMTYAKAETAMPAAVTEPVRKLALSNFTNWILCFLPR